MMLCLRPLTSTVAHFGTATDALLMHRSTPHAGIPHARRFRTRCLWARALGLHTTFRLHTNLRLRALTRTV